MAGKVPRCLLGCPSSGVCRGAWPLVAGELIAVGNPLRIAGAPPAVHDVSVARVAEHQAKSNMFRSSLHISPPIWCCQIQSEAPTSQPAVSLNTAQGGYWTLDKRHPDLHRMAAEWRRTVASFAGNFPQVFRRPSVQVSTCSGMHAGAAI